MVDFIRKLKGISFTETLRCLGVNGGSFTRACPQEARRREFVKKFNAWCGNYSKYLCERLRLCNRIDALVKTSEDMELDGLPEAYFLRDVYQYQSAILSGVDNELKFELYREVRFGKGI